MEIVIKETNRTSGKQTLLFDKRTNSNFLLTSIDNDVVNKSFIVQCDDNCNVKNWNEVFTMIPSQHDKILEMFDNGMLSSQDFNFIKM